VSDRLPVVPGPSPLRRSPEQIRAEIERTREELSGSVALLRARSRELTDWRRQVREHREVLITAAAVGGFVVGGMLALRRRRRH